MPLHEKLFSVMIILTFTCGFHYVWFILKTWGRYLEILPALFPSNFPVVFLWEPSHIYLCSFCCVLRIGHHEKFYLAITYSFNLKIFSIYTGQPDVEYISRFAVRVYMEHKTGLHIANHLCFYLVMLLILFPIQNICVYFQDALNGFSQWDRVWLL